jgi:spore coat polysaccharide biosynthesis protein SpsF (cytidylyltransferase family)
MTTKTAQFTPGPLKAVQIFIENSPCTWAVQRKNIREQWGKPSIATYIDNEADARLFAAAPAMYEALKALVDVIPSVVKMIPYGVPMDISQLHDNAKAAMAQAEGW